LVVELWKSGDLKVCWKISLPKHALITTIYLYYLLYVFITCFVCHQLFPSCEFICVISVCPSRAHYWNKIYLIFDFDLVKISPLIHNFFIFFYYIKYILISNWPKFESILSSSKKDILSCYRFSCYYRFSDVAINSVNPPFIWRLEFSKNG
jgi:hypothetical protein